MPLLKSFFLFLEFSKTFQYELNFNPCNSLSQPQCTSLGDISHSDNMTELSL